MKATVLKKMLRINQVLLDPLKSKKELISKRSEKLDPNNEKNLQKPLIKKGTNRKIHDDGFEHRSSEEITDSI